MSQPQQPKPTQHRPLTKREQNLIALKAVTDVLNRHDQKQAKTQPKA